jgi:hypothetical protein
MKLRLFEVDVASRTAAADWRIVEVYRSWEGGRCDNGRRHVLIEVVEDSVDVTPIPGVGPSETAVAGNWPECGGDRSGCRTWLALWPDGSMKMVTTDWTDSTEKKFNDRHSRHREWPISRTELVCLFGCGIFHLDRHPPDIHCERHAKLLGRRERVP